MTPDARLAACIDLIAEIETSLAGQGPAADVLVRQYFRQRRYAGGGDRRAITGFVYDLLRRRGELVWRLNSVGLPTDARHLCLMQQRLDGPLDDALFGGPHAPERPTVETMESLSGALELGSPPGWASANLPEWLAEALSRRFGEKTDAEFAALAGRAATDIRANLLVTDRDSLRDTLVEAGYEATSCRWSPWGLRLNEAHGLNALEAFRQGQFDIQDDSSQVAVLLSGAAPRNQVLELGAGGGGKTLALAAMMRNTGQIYALDVDRRRLEEAKKRAQRAGARNIQFHRITTGAEKRAVQLENFRTAADVVLVDAPCSGSGAWRRNPEARWRLSPEALAGHMDRQASLLTEALHLARPDGHVVYMTCSLLRQENEQVVEEVLEAVPGWTIVDYRARLDAAGLSDLPTASDRPDMLQMTPAMHGTDGFFLAILAPAA